MYRCYLLREGHIVKADNLDAATVEQAVVAARQLLAGHVTTSPFDGIEIWLGATMVYADADHDTGLPGRSRALGIGLDEPVPPSGAAVPASSVIPN